MKDRLVVVTRAWNEVEPALKGEYIRVRRKILRQLVVEQPRGAGCQARPSESRPDATERFVAGLRREWIGRRHVDSQRGVAFDESRTKPRGRLIVIPEER